MSEVIEAFVGLLVAVAGLGWLARKLQIAYPILLVIGGAVLGFIPGLPHVRLDPDLVFQVFLPPLLFPAALFTPWRDFRANLRPILLLAIGLVLFTTVTVGWLVHVVVGLPLAAAFVLGAIISPPDAIAATAIAERLSVPRRIVAILEGESLVNDATALVAYRFGVAAVVTGAFSLSRASVQFVIVGLGGVAAGLVIGAAHAWIQKRLNDAPIEITISLLTPYVAYLGAERLGVSGVLAVVSAGLFLGWRSPEITTSTTRLQAGPFWNMLEFLLNGFVFILIGLHLPEVIQSLAGRSAVVVIRQAVLISLAVILIRILWVFPATYLPRLIFRSLCANDPYPRWQHVTIVAWTGMRGVVSLAAALALPMTTQRGAPFPERHFILFLTFTVILATLVLQGLTLPWLIRWLGVEDDHGAAREERTARLKANRAALNRLKEIAEPDPAKADALQRLRIEYEDRIRQLEAYEPGESDSSLSLFSLEYEQLSLEGLKVERQVLLELRNASVISDEILREVQRDIDLAEARLHHQE